jgi:hypothetical protein
MAMEAIQTSKTKISRQRAATLYNVPKPTLRARITSRQPISNYRPVAYKLIKLEEKVIV